MSFLSKHVSIRVSVLALVAKISIPSKECGGPVFGGQERSSIPVSVFIFRFYLWLPAFNPLILGNGTTSVLIHFMKPCVYPNICMNQQNVSGNDNIYNFQCVHPSKQSRVYSKKHHTYCPKNPKVIQG